MTTTRAPIAFADPGAAATDAELTAIQLRTQFGLRHDLDYVRLVDASADADTSDLGIPLSPAEHADFQRRAQLADRTLVIDETYAKDSTYSGSWIDQAAGGVLHVAFTKSLTDAEMVELKTLLPDGTQLDVSKVEWSLLLLNALRMRIRDDQAALASTSQARLSAWGVNVQTNSVTVDVPSAMTAATRDALASQYGPMVEIKQRDYLQGESARDVRTGVLYGGEAISRTGENCTNGYSDARGDSGQTPYSVTAGHCGANGTTWVQGKGGTRSIGSAHANARAGKTTTYCDCVAIGPLSTGLPTNQVLVDSNGKFTFTKTGVANGGVVCQAGFRSYEYMNRNINACGNVNYNSRDETINDDFGTATLYDAVEVSAFNMNGDSGATVGQGTGFLGILSAGNAPDMNTPGDTYALSKATHFNVVGLSLTY